MMTKDEARKAFEEILEGLKDEDLDALMVVADTDTQGAILIHGGAQAVANLCMASIKHQIDNAPEEHRDRLASIYRNGVMDITSGHINRLGDLLEGTMRELNKGMVN